MTRLEERSLLFRGFLEDFRIKYVCSVLEKCCFHDQTYNFDELHAPELFDKFHCHLINKTKHLAHYNYIYKHVNCTT